MNRLKGIYGTRGTRTGAVKIHGYGAAGASGPCPGWRFIFQAALAFCILGSCGLDKGDAGEGVREVRVVAAALRELPDEVSGFGVLSYVKKVDIAAAQEGVIARLYRREGEEVREGEVLALIENTQIKLAVDRAENACAQALAGTELARALLVEGEFQAEAQLRALEKAAGELAQVRRNYDEQERKHLDQETLFTAGGVSEENIRSSRFALEAAREELRLMEQEFNIRLIGFRDEDLLNAGLSVPGDPGERDRAFITLATMTARAELNAALAVLQGARKELESMRLAQSELRLVSPAPGVLGARYLEEGERVQRGDKLFTLMDSRSLYALFPVRESEAPRLKEGMDALIKVDGTGGSYAGTVDLVSPAADSQTFTFQVRVLISGEEQRRAAEEFPAPLKPGMFARVSVSLGEPRRLITLPETALAYAKDDEAAAFIVSGNQVSLRGLALGLSLGAEREIRSGLLHGELAVERPDTSLKDGEYVLPVY
jgi:RND family efflux transporter MFP subunit